MHNRRRMSSLGNLSTDLRGGVSTVLPHNQSFAWPGPVFHKQRLSGEEHREGDVQGEEQEEGVCQAGPLQVQVRQG